jgi:hypothetical protein
MPEAYPKPTNGRCAPSAVAMIGSALSGHSVALARGRDAVALAELCRAASRLTGDGGLAFCRGLLRGLPRDRGAAVQAHGERAASAIGGVAGSLVRITETAPARTMAKGGTVHVTFAKGV